MNQPITVIAAHPDDEVLGCGGTLAKWTTEGRAAHVLFLADGETSRDLDPTQAQNKISDRRSAANKACEILGVSSVEFLDFPDNRLDSVDLLDVVKSVEAFIAKHEPETVLTHFSGDVNIDHRIVHDAVIAATRPKPGSSIKEVLFFEVASSTEWRPPASEMAFSPDYFVDVSDHLESKLAALKSYAAELFDFPHPRSVEAVSSLAKWRGASIGVAAAEGFVTGRVIK